METQILVGNEEGYQELIRATVTDTTLTYSDANPNLLWESCSISKRTVSIMFSKVQDKISKADEKQVSNKNRFI